MTAATISATADGSGNLTLNWSGAQGNGRTISGYDIVLSDGTHEGASAVATTTMPGHVGTTYTYTIVTANNAGRKSSAPTTSSNSAQPKPGAPTASATQQRPDRSRTPGAPRPSTEPVTYTISGATGSPLSRSHRPEASTFAGSYGTTYTFTVTATSRADVTSSKSDSVTPVNPYSISLCYGGAAPIGNYLGVTWSGNDGAAHHITLQRGYGSTLDFSAAQRNLECRARTTDARRQAISTLGHHLDRQRHLTLPPAGETPAHADPPPRPIDPRRHPCP